MPIVLLICMINGLASPAIPWVVGVAPLWLSGFLPSNISVVFYLASLLISTLTFMLSGVVASIFERVADRPESDRMTYVV